MKKIKGGKRAGAGRKKTGRKTEVVSFSVPKVLVNEIKEMVKARLFKAPKKETGTIPLPKDLINPVKISAINLKDEVVISDIAQCEKTTIQIKNYEAELQTIPDVGLGKKRRLFIHGQISKLKNQLK